MLCPCCQEQMTLYSEGETVSKKNAKSYKRLSFKCANDDVWGQIEIPQESLEKQDLATVASQQA